MLGSEKEGSPGGQGDETLAEILERAGAPTQSHLMPTQQGPPVRSMVLTEEIGLAATEASGRYTNATEYGRGGMGRVLLVHDTFLSRDVALKELIAESDSTGQTVVGSHTPAESAHFLQRFLREARITGNLEHPSIVPVYELGRRPNGGHYYTMKLVRGRTLHRAIRDARTLEDRLKLLPHVIDLCNAIAYAHSKGVIHRDIKPSNVMVGSYGETVVIDWGLARVLNQDDPYAAVLDVPLEGETSESAAQTMAGVPVGTPQYMSPEQAAGRLDDVGTHSDVYALGVVLYEVLAGRTPFTGTQSREVLRQVLHNRPAPVTVHEPSVPPALARLCATAMARRPEDRFGSAAELADELVRFTTGALVKSYDYNFWELARHYYRQNRALCNSVLASVAVIMAVVVVAYAYILDANRKERIQRQAAEAEAYRANIQVVATDVKNQSFEKARERLLLQPPHLRDWEWGLLFAQCHQDYATGSAHTERVYRLVAAPNTDRIISIGDDNRVIVWSTPDLQQLHEFDVPTLPGINVDISADETRLVLSQMGQGVQLYDLRDYSLLRTFEHDGDAYASAAISSDGTRVAVGTQSGTLIVFNADDGTEIRRDSGNGTIRHVFAMNHDGNMLLTLDGTERTTLIDVFRGVPVLEINGTRPRVSEDKRTFSILNGERAELYDLDSGEIRYSVQATASPFTTVFVNSNGRRLATLEGERRVRVWDTASDTLVNTLDVPPAWRIIGLNHDGSRLITATLPNAIQIWDTADGTLVTTLLGHSNHVDTAVLDTDNKFCFSAGGDSTIKSWQVPSTLSSDESASSNSVTDLDWSPEAGLVAAATLSGTTHFLHQEDLTNSFTLSSHSPNTKTLIEFSPDGRKAAVLLSESLVVELSLPDLKIVHQYPDTGSHIRSMDYCPSGAAFATGNSDNTVHVWRNQSTADTFEFTEHRSEVVSMAFLNDGRRIATGDLHGDLYIWDWHSGEIEMHRAFNGNSVGILAAGESGTIIACALSGGSIRILRPDDGPAELSLLGHSDSIEGLAFSESDSRLFSTSFRGDLKIWNAANGQEMLELETTSAKRSQIEVLTSSLLLGSRDSSLAAYSSFPLTTPTTDDISPESVDRYKRNRLVLFKEHSVPLIPSRLTSLVSNQTLGLVDERLELISRHIDSAAPYREPGWNPLSAIGLKPGDEVIAVSGSPVASFSDFKERWNNHPPLKNQALGDLQLTVRRDQEDFVIQYIGIESLLEERQFIVSRDEALALTQGIAQRLKDFKQVFIDYSQNLSRKGGALLPNNDALEGVWIPPAGSPEDADTLRTYGILQRDRIISIGGEPITSYRAFMASLNDAIRALTDGWSGSIEIVIERNSFHYISVTLSI